MSSDFLHEKSDGVYLSVKIQPRAKRNHIGALTGQELKVSITAPPVDGAANEALVSFLADILGCSRRTITIVRGQSSRHKVIRVEGVSAEDLRSRLTTADLTKR